MSKAKEIVKKLAKIFTEIESTSNGTQILMCMDDAERVIERFANEQTQPLIDEIKELKDLNDRATVDFVDANNEIAELKKQSFIEKVARGNIEMTPAQVLEYAELKQSNTWVSVDEPPKINDENSRVSLPMYVELLNGEITIADYTKSKFKNGDERVGAVYEPIWICRERGIDNSGTQIFPIKYQPLPKQ